MNLVYCLNNIFSCNQLSFICATSYWLYEIHFAKTKVFFRFLTAQFISRWLSSSQAFLICWMDFTVLLILIFCFVKKKTFWQILIQNLWTKRSQATGNFTMMIFDVKIIFLFADSDRSYLIMVKLKKKINRNCTVTSNLKDVWHLDVLHRNLSMKALEMTGAVWVSLTLLDMQHKLNVHT